MHQTRVEAVTTGKQKVPGIRIVYRYLHDKIPTLAYIQLFPYPNPTLIQLKIVLISINYTYSL